MNPDSSDYKKTVWEKEYQTRKNLPSSNTYVPSRALRNFLEEFSEINKNSALDLGSGNGRNSIYLIQQGFKNVTGIEFSKIAFDQAVAKAQEENVSDKIQFINRSIGQKQDFPDQSFDLIIDMMVMHSLNKTERQILFEEIKRLLKPGGHFVFYTIASESEAAQDLIKKWRGDEPNSYRFKVDNDIITEKTFTQKELIKDLAPLKRVFIDSKEEFTPAFGDVFKRLYYYGVFRKALGSNDDLLFK